MRQKYKRLLIIGFVFLIIIIMLICGLASMAFNKMYMAFQKTNDETFLAWAELESINIELNAICEAMKRLTLFNNQLLPQNHILLQEAIQDVNLHDLNIKKYFKEITMKNNENLILKVKQSYEEWSNIREQLIYTLLIGNSEENNDYLVEVGCMQIENIKEKMVELITLYKLEAKDIITHYEKEYHRVLVQLISLSAMAIIIAIVVAYYVANKLLNLENTLFKSEAHYRMLFNSMLNGYALHEIVLDEQGIPCDYIFLDVNPAFEIMTGLKKDTCIGKKVCELLPNTEVYWIENYGKVALTGESMYFVNYAQEQDKYFEVFAYSPAKLQFATIITDITQRELANQALRSSERRLKRAQAIAHVGNWELDLNNNKIWASQEAFNIYGIEQSSSYITLSTIQQIVDREDRPKLDETLDKLIKKNEPYDVVFKIKRVNDKTERYVHSIALAERDEDNKVIKILGVIQDITNEKNMQKMLKTNQAKHREIIQSMSDVVVIMNSKKEIVYRSPNTERIFGLAPSDFENKDAWWVVHPSDRTRARYIVNQLLQAGHGARAKLEYKYKCKDGTYKDVENNAVNLIKNQNIKGILFTLHDITESKRREKKIEYLYRHDVLTGLYNRSFYTEEMKRLDSENQLPLSIIVADLNGLKLINDMLGYSEGDKRIKKAAQILTKFCRKEDVLVRYGGDEFCMLLPHTSYKEVENIYWQITKAFNNMHIEQSDEFSNLSISLGYATKNRPDKSIEETQTEAEEEMYRHKLLERKSIHSISIASMKSTLFEKSHETEEHAERLVQLSLRVGKALNLTSIELDKLELAAALHDIGKMGIDNSILTKPGSLNTEEWRMMKQHPEIGYRIAVSNAELNHIAHYILCHHERWDGKGYPQGLVGEGIPLISRIISIADAYDAMTSDRPYRKALSKEEALAEIVKSKGSQFDPTIAEIFIKLMNQKV